MLGRDPVPIEHQASLPLRRPALRHFIERPIPLALLMSNILI